MSAPETFPWSRRPIYAVAFLALLAWGAAGFDYYDRHFGTVEDDFLHPLVEEWGILPPQQFYITYDSSKLIKFKNDWRVALILHILYANIDKMSDTAIEKSSAYIITGDRTKIAISDIRGLNLHSSAPFTVEFDLILIPEKIEMSKITSIKDVETFGGS